MHHEINIHRHRLFRKDIVLIQLAGHQTGHQTRTYLEEGHEEIQLLLRRPTVEAVPTRVEKSAHQTNAKEVIRQIQRIELPRNWSAAFYTALDHDQQMLATYHGRM